MIITRLDIEFHHFIKKNNGLLKGVSVRILAIYTKIIRLSIFLIIFYGNKNNKRHYKRLLLIFIEQIKVVGQ